MLLLHALTALFAQTPTPTPTPTTDVLEEVGEALGAGADPCPSNGVVCEFVLDQTGNETLAALVGTVLPILLTIILVFLAAAVLTRLVKRVVQRLVARTATESHDAMRAISRRAPSLQATLSREERQLARERSEQRAETVGSVAASIAGFVIWLIATLIALGQLNIDIGPLVAGAGVAGVALGFGAQSLVRDFLSGIFMLLEDQYGVGDIIDVGEAVGTVEAITLRVTRLRDVEGTVWHVPNGEIHRIGNMSQLWSRSLLDIGVAYETDLDQASRVIKDVAHGMAIDPDWKEQILEEPELWGVEQFGPNEVVLRLVIKTKPAAQWKVNREFRRRLKQAFDTEGIEIPFPQRTLWLRQDGGIAAGVPAAALGGDPEDAGSAGGSGTGQE